MKGCVMQFGRRGIMATAVSLLVVAVLLAYTAGSVLASSRNSAGSIHITVLPGTAVQNDYLSNILTLGISVVTLPVSGGGGGGGGGAPLPKPPTTTPATPTPTPEPAPVTTPVPDVPQMPTSTLTPEPFPDETYVATVAPSGAEQPSNLVPVSDSRLPASTWVALVIVFLATLLGLGVLGSYIWSRKHRDDLES